MKPYYKSEDEIRNDPEFDAWIDFEFSYHFEKSPKYLFCDPDFPDSELQQAKQYIKDNCVAFSTNGDIILYPVILMHHNYCWTEFDRRWKK